MEIQSVKTNEGRGNKGLQSQKEGTIKLATEGGRHDRHLSELFLQLEGIDYKRTRVGRPG